MSWISLPTSLKHLVIFSIQPTVVSALDSTASGGKLAKVLSMLLSTKNHRGLSTHAYFGGQQPGGQNASHLRRVSPFVRDLPCTAYRQ
jgi:hypothetical protein